VLHVGNKSASIYINSATTIIEANGQVKIVGLGLAMVTASKLSLILEGMGNRRTSVVLESKEMPGRILDPKDPNALRNRRFIPTGKSTRVPRLTIVHTSK
jgi:hypothetical protein